MKIIVSLASLTYSGLITNPTFSTQNHIGRIYENDKCLVVRKCRDLQLKSKYICQLVQIVDKSLNSLSMQKVYNALFENNPHIIAREDYIDFIYNLTKVEKLFIGLCNFADTDFAHFKKDLVTKNEYRRFASAKLVYSIMQDIGSQLFNRLSVNRKFNYYDYILNYLIKLDKKDHYFLCHYLCPDLFNKSSCCNSYIEFGVLDRLGQMFDYRTHRMLLEYDQSLHGDIMSKKLIKFFEHYSAIFGFKASESIPPINKLKVLIGTCLKDIQYDLLFEEVKKAYDICEITPQTGQLVEKFMGVSIWSISSNTITMLENYKSLNAYMDTREILLDSKKIQKWYLRHHQTLDSDLITLLRFICADSDVGCGDKAHNRDALSDILFGL